MGSARQELELRSFSLSVKYATIEPVLSTAALFLMRGMLSEERASVALGILGRGGGLWFAGVLGAGRRWEFGCSPAVGFLLCGGMPGLWPRHLLPGPLWIADHCGSLGCFGLWVPWGRHLGFSVWEWPLPHSKPGLKKYHLILNSFYG